MDQKEEVKSKVDIVEVISGYIPLKKSGRNYSGLCPFHGEKTPSFMVSAERQAFKCFGCGEGGDVFTFLEKIEGWDFREALEEMAKRVGVKLKKFEGTERSRTREKIFEINNLTNKFYAHILNNHKLGENARKYLLDRGIKKTSWAQFGLGYAPEAWENLVRFMTKRKFSVADLASSGLIIARNTRDKSYYDRFRGRVMFPLKNARGEVCGFSGRLISENAKEAKYVNTSQTEVFNKGSLLFGLDVARDSIRKENEAVLVEGEFDVISAHQIGMKNVVASKGTALTESQVGLLSRIAETVVICFDSDIAGDAAARRGLELLDLAGVEAKVALMGKYKDPDEFCQKDPGGFRGAITSAIGVYDYFINSALSRYDPKTAQGKKKIGSEVIGIISKISDDLVRGHYVDLLSKSLSLDNSVVGEAVNKKMPLLLKQEESAELPFKLTYEEYFLALVFLDDKVDKEILGLVDADDFVHKSSGELWAWIHAIIGGSKTQKYSLLLKKAPEKFSAFIDNLYLVSGSLSFAADSREVELRKAIKRIKMTSAKRRLSGISHEIKEAEQAGNKKLIEALTSEFNNLSVQISKL